MDNMEEEEDQVNKSRIVSEQKRRRLEELCVHDLRFFFRKPCQRGPCFYHDEGQISLSNILSTADNHELLLGVYDLIYTTGYSSCAEVNRSIVGTLTLCKESSDGRTWGAVDCDSMQSGNSANVFEGSFSFVQAAAAAAQCGRLEGCLHKPAPRSALSTIAWSLYDDNWFRSLPWNLRRITENCDCVWSPDECESRELLTRERKDWWVKRRNPEFSWMWNHLNLPDTQLVKNIYAYLGFDLDVLAKPLRLKEGDLYLYVSWGGFDEVGWTVTVARRRTEQADLEEYYQPIPIFSEEDIW